MNFKIIKLSSSSAISYFIENSMTHHREDGPAIEKIDGSYKAWFYNGSFHREGGPARLWADGSQMWRVKTIPGSSMEHRIGGPSSIILNEQEYLSNGKSWRRSDQRHRLNAPAVLFQNGAKQWWEFGKFIGSKK